MELEKTLSTETSTDSRRNLISEMASDCTDNYCTIRVILKAGRKPIAPCCENCRGCGWCENRETLYKTQMSERMMTQAKLMEVLRYLHCIHDKKEEDWDTTQAIWADPIVGITDLFRYAWDGLGIKSLKQLKRVCVYIPVDTPLILEGYPTAAEELHDAFKALNNPAA